MPVKADLRALPWLEWLEHPQSVMEPGWHGPVRTLVKVLGLDDPTQVMAVGVPLEVGPMTGGALAAAAAKFPRFARALEVVKELPGFFSRVDEAAAALPNVAAPAKVASVLKQAASGEEILARGVPAWLEAQGGQKVTREAVQAHLAENPLTVNIKTLGGNEAARTEALRAQQAAGDQVVATRRAAFDDPKDWVGVGDVDRSNVQWWALEAAGGDARALRKLQDVVVDPDHLARVLEFGHARRASVAAGDAVAAVPTPRWGDRVLPGGTNYKETLITLPTERRWANGARITAEDLSTAEGRAAADRVGSYVDEPFVKRSHFEEPNIVAHVRSNDRALSTGERGRFLEEVQSDWHQTGRDEGYRPAPGSAAARALEAEDSAATQAHTATVRAMEDAHARVKYGTGSDEYAALSDQLYDAKATWRRLGETPGMAGRAGTPARDAYLQAAAEVDRLSEAMQALQGRHVAAYEAAQEANSTAYARVEAARAKLRGGVPDAPFKDSWPDLALKQQLLEVAADPSATWIGHTTAATQIERGQLSRQIDQLHWSPSRTAAGEGYLEAMKDGSPVLQKSVKAAELPGLVGKEVAEKLLAAPAVKTGYSQRALHTLEGLDLDVGGKGMRYFYDELLPARLAKIVKPFGGTVERTTIRQPLYDMATQTKNLTEAAPAWIVRLTPAMKARILREGVSLLSVGGLAVGAGAQAVANGDQKSAD